MATIECSQCHRQLETKFFKIIGPGDSRYEWGAFQWEDKCNECLDFLDHELYQMTWHELIAEVKKLRMGIRHHRDTSWHTLCWYHPELWSLLPDKVEPKPEVPPREEFLRRCALYRDSLSESVNEQ